MNEKYNVEKSSCPKNRNSAQSCYYDFLGFSSCVMIALSSYHLAYYIIAYYNLSSDSSSDIFTNYKLIECECSTFMLILSFINFGKAANGLALLTGRSFSYINLVRIYCFVNLVEVVSVISLMVFACISNDIVIFTIFFSLFYSILYSLVLCKVTKLSNDSQYSHDDLIIHKIFSQS